MAHKHAKKANPSLEGEAPPAPPKHAPANAEAPEDPEDYSDPICVCEPEPYWQEVAERLEREKEAASKTKRPT